jgi:hypothetical protein
LLGGAIALGEDVDLGQTPAVVFQADVRAYDVTEGKKEFLGLLGPVAAKFLVQRAPKLHEIRAIISNAKPGEQ